MGITIRRKQQTLLINYGTNNPQKDAILSNLPSVFANEEGRIKLAEYIIAGEISWEEIEEMGSLSASQIAELRLIVSLKRSAK